MVSKDVKFFQKTAKNCIFVFSLGLMISIGGFSCARGSGCPANEAHAKMNLEKAPSKHGKTDLFGKPKKKLKRRR
jgi:hypothetical protein